MDMTKENFRKNCLEKFCRSSKFNKIYRDNLINRQLITLFKEVKGQNILCYWPLGLEVDIRKTIARIRKNNNIFLPFMQEISFKMVPFRLPLSRKKFNIYEAGNSFKNIRKIDVAIIPAVGVDKKSRRIGFGKGMYDRFFEKLKNDPYKIFLQSQICYTEKDICDTHDISCDMLITPRIRLLHRRKVNADYRTVRGFNSHRKRGSRFFHF
ncbi:5-formyltetrahydrofolate cyclo-ligase [Sulfurimonas sp. HSL-1716]|uniref:5-formyltetrahydrofolate cyclo-ligase n=1 Tax=Hydrocurvibacter sulfurireducens TaxID=3131937 RepID=UPI0031F761B2